MSSLPVEKPDTALSIAKKAVGAVADIILFVVVLGFTGITMIALAIAAPLALGISALIGAKSEQRAGWKPVKAN